MKSYLAGSRISALVLWVAISIISSFPALSSEPVRIGVLAFRPKAQTQAQWQPLAVALKQAMPTRDFVVQALTYPELDLAVASRQLDFVLTNPGHYLMLSKRAGLSAPLATLAIIEGGQRVSVMGGVIFTRAERADITDLSDLKGKTVSIASKESLGGYQMQLIELKRSGVLERDISPTIVGMPHDNIVDSVMAGTADVGFVRGGVLEQMAREGKLDLDSIKILNLQNLPGFPVAVSTQLFPEWPFAALPHIDENLSRSVVATLYHLEENEAATRAIGIHGFVIPADYTTVSDVLRELRLPPFDVAPTFTFYDLWQKYAAWVVALGMLASLLIISTIALFLQNRRARQSELRFFTLFEHAPEPVWIIANGRYIDCNVAALEMLGFSDKASVIAASPSSLSPQRQPDGEYSSIKAERFLESALAGEDQNFEWVHLKNDGSEIIVDVCLALTILNKQKVVLCTWHDVTARKKFEAQVHQMAFYDELTKLPNRRLLNDRLSQAMSISKRSGCYGALMFLDLDNFKPLNDAHGHGVGDLLLIEVASRLKGCVRERDTVSRFGGDEFVVMLSELSTERDESIAQAKFVAEKVLGALSEPYKLRVEYSGAAYSTIEHHCTASIGVSLFINHESSEQDIIKCADMAMYQAKEAGRNSISFYG